MATTRLRISLDEDQAERIRIHARAAGMDVRSFMLIAVTRQMSAQDKADAEGPKPPEER